MAGNDSPYYPVDRTLREARDVYFDHFGFDNGGYDKKWVKLKAGPIPIYFPNIEARVIAVKYHDLHHVLTGYPANWVGEAEIGAWEIASGCGKHYPAWVLNLDALAIGLFIAPRKTFRAFVRGRRSRNLYREPFDDKLLAETVGAARRRLSLDLAMGPAKPGEIISFIFWSIISMMTLLVPWALGLLALVYLLSLIT